MKRIIAICFAMLVTCNIASANLNDTRSSMTALYGDFRLIIDTDNQAWTKAEWESKGFQRAKAASYMYYFNRKGLGIQMEVQYQNDKEQSVVKLQRITPNMAIKVKEFQAYFPELSVLLNSPKAEFFSTYSELSRHFQEDKSPVFMGVVVRTPSDVNRGSYNTLIAFNIQDEGRMIKDPQYISGDTYIREFIIREISKSDVTENMSNDWQPVKKFF